MFKDLTYSVTFPTNGISFSGTHSFQPGITAVIGPNGSGKSFTSIELCRYLLFGKKALRGPASDYKTLEVEGTVVIRGDEYKIVRTKKAESVTRVATDEVLAVNTEAVNAKLRELMGFSLEVFDVANAAVQKKVEAFSQLAPTARRKMIDDLVGLTSQEAVEKACRDEGNGFRREAEALSKQVRPVPEPVAPDGYIKSTEIEAIIADQRELIRQRNALQRTIDSVGPQPATVVYVDERDVEALEQHEAERAAAAANVLQLGRAIAEIADAEYTAEQLDAAEALIAYEAAVSERDRVARHLLECPNCEHKWLPSGDQLPVLPPKPNAEIRLSAKEIAAFRIALARADEKARMQATLEATVLPEDKSAELKEMRMKLAAYQAYEKAMASWKARSEDALVAMEELQDLPKPRADLADLEALFVAARVYETELKNYDKAKAEQDELLADITEKQRKSEAYKLGAQKLADARAELKAHLAPSFSRVASSLISQMTAGKLNHILIDEEMNISVDGQDLTTLSGAGETVANLALRIALGQVLVSKVFPVFIGDELDSDMDKERAQATAECFDRLRDRLKQIILITHKPVDYADHVIDLT